MTVGIALLRATCESGLCACACAHAARVCWWQNAERAGVCGTHAGRANGGEGGCGTVNLLRLERDARDRL
eukprot:2562809-Pleurochrysis_carterae.AAC.1